jgi:glycosyltransferase involved in cell wall biosynthesis
VLNAANSAIFRPRTQEPVLWQMGGKYELVAHGLVVQRYGLETMVRAVALLAPEIPGIVLHVYGKGDYLPEMEALALELGISDRVIAHGFVPEEELLDGIARAHAGVIAARRDTFRDLTHTQKMYEYVAMHKPVVIAETPAVRTHFDEACFQFFVSDDATDLARALRDLYYNPLRALAMVESASRRYRTYAWEAQRHVYCDAVLGLAPQYAPAPLVPQEPIVHVPAVPQYAPALIASQEHISHVPAVMEATLAMSSMDRSGVVTPVEEVGK